MSEEPRNRTEPDMHRMPGSAASESGAALIELAVILPFLLLLFFGAVDLVRMFQARQIMTALSRESANTVFRECLELDGQVLTDCIGDVWNRLTQVSGIALPGTRVVISLYRWSGTTSTATRIAYCDSSPPPTPSGCDVDGINNSRFTAASFPAGNTPLTVMIRETERLAVGEVFYTYQPMFGFLGILGINLQFHDVTFL